MSTNDERDVQCNLCGLPCTIGSPGSEHQDTRAGLIEARVDARQRLGRARRRHVVHVRQESERRRKARDG